MFCVLRLLFSWFRYEKFTQLGCMLILMGVFVLVVLCEEDNRNESIKYNKHFPGSRVGGPGEYIWRESRRKGEVYKRRFSGSNGNLRTLRRGDASRFKLGAKNGGEVGTGEGGVESERESSMETAKQSK